MSGNNAPSSSAFPLDYARPGSGTRGQFVGMIGLQLETKP
jgi:hypothetical protein